MDLNLNLRPSAGNQQRQDYTRHRASNPGVQRSIISHGANLPDSFYITGTRNIFHELENLRNRIAALEDTLEIIDELDLDEAMALARDYFATRPGKKSYPTDLAQALGTSVSQAIDVCEALEREGLIAEDEK